MKYPTLVQSFLAAVEHYPNPRTQMHKEGGRWNSASSAEMLRRVAGLATGLGQSGIFQGDRVAIFSPNRPEWHVADLAILGLGAVTVPIYFNESPDRLVYILNHSEAKAAIAVGPAQVDLLLACRDRLPLLETIVVAAYGKPLPREIRRYQDLIGRADPHDIGAYASHASRVSPSDLAAIIYTSGTTGEPKGVMLTHANFSSNALDTGRVLELRRTDVSLSFLPLAHVYQRIMDYMCLFRGVAIAYVERMDEVPQALLEVRPTVAAAVPRFFEKIYAGIMEARGRLGPRRLRLFDWGMAVAREAVGWRAYGRPLPFKRKLVWMGANLLVYRRIRRRLGSRIRLLNSGSAPLSRGLGEFFWSIGVPVLEGYGLTETSPVVSASSFRARRLGTVGRPIPNVEVRIADDGEILVRGPCVMKGYFKAPEATAEVLSPDGWLRTGDIGLVDADGFLAITDRKKDLLKTAGGKLIAPQPIESLLKSSPYILNACVLGDRRKYVAALLVPNCETLRARARQEAISLGSAAEIAAHPWAQKLIGEEIARLTEPLAQYDRPKRFLLLDRDFAYERGELTYTMKLRRRWIEEKYQSEVEKLFADTAEPLPELSS
ncbi:MAG TPA: long-chain fatty acid--CoA ligase [Candidatus Dormibacteraeota bacterium]|nr:long-chain fatty acid--CoA ligase [Candidatus Dormibacteraeota bacterium]